MRYIIYRESWTRNNHGRVTIMEQPTSKAVVETIDGVDVWVIDIDSLEELMALVRKHYYIEIVTSPDTFVGQPATYPFIKLPDIVDQ